ncbi:TATA box-binding protein-associated factor RNA polymerase I subunit A [Octopus sinensis]|uniref:TATA box-binding protein-associated factor RNA polymerase I subunit A n=1 Tax=Octopus sinensis TaxID=2607531 RepID=A0A6P7S8T7_9MOLL|nr:TATA box-binding protein-associated factor RNA polymerase I subunit A [Octopus sinensis]
MDERLQSDDDSENNLNYSSDDSLYGNTDVAIKVQLRRMKKILSIILHDTECYNEFLSTIDEDVSTDEEFQWLEDIWCELAKKNNLSYEKNTRGVPQKLEFLLRECLLMHRWHELAQILSISHQESTCDLKRSAVKIGFELLYSNPLKDRLNFIERMVKLFCMFARSEVTHSDIQLEQLWYQLQNNSIDEAIQELQSVALSSRQIVSVSRNVTYNKALFLAYQGLIWYLKWLDTRKSKMKSDSAEIESGTINFALDSQMTKMLSCFSAVTVKENIAVRDIFIKAERHALEMNENFEAVEKLLKDYCLSNPENPNSHKFYYDFLCQTNACEQKKVKVLRNFVKYVPSDPLVLTLCDMISDNYGDVLKYLFDLLDYSCWKTMVDPWSRLAKLLETLTQTYDTDTFSSEVESVWSDRKSWWPSYHFTPLSIAKENEIILYKALVAIFLPDKQLSEYINNVKCSVNPQKQTIISEAEATVFKKMKL